MRLGAAPMGSAAQGSKTRSWPQGDGDGDGDGDDDCPVDMWCHLETQ